MLILVFCYQFKLQAQPSPIEKTRHPLHQTESDTAKIYHWYKKANKLIYTESDSAIHYALKIDSLSKQINFTKGHSLALNCLGNIYWAKGSLKEGLSYYIQSKEVAHEIGDDNLIAKNIGSMGLIYRAAGNHKAALSYYRRALPLFISLQNGERIAVTYNNMGKCYLEMGVYDSATHYFNLAHPPARVHRPSILPILSFNHSDVFFRRKEYLQAEKHLKTSLKSSQSFNDERMIIRNKQMLAEVKLFQDSIEVAKSLALDAVKKAEATGVKELMFVCYETLSHVYAKTHQYDSAYHFLSLFNIYKDSVQSEDVQEKINFHDFEQQQKEILMLSKEKILEKEIRQKQTASIYILSLLLVAIAMLAIVLYRSKHQKTTDNKLLQFKNEEINRQKEEMAAQADKFQDLNQLKNKLFSIISHDLRSPLNSLSGSLELVQRGLIDNKEFKAFLPELIKNVSYTNTLLDNLLHWAKNQLEGPEINSEIINLKKIASLKIELLQHQAVHKNISLNNEIQDDVFVYADEIMIQIVLQNLLSNAIKFCRPNDEIYVRLAYQDGFAVMCIQDTGTGIEKDNLDKIFSDTSFSTRGTANEKGTGLGLMLCKDFVIKNGGEIWVESTLGEGSSFYFSLILSVEEPNKTEKSPSV
ncbi:tetratricopeptide repeat-containing sensor histidine kinase [Catalinimonas alkaloidigena]|uniref:tetratricopeptide repeat-containing sensor histidine kinase n=1 Tax=Catalinimonas alkaloidigena TaxID=1075417 RepID=UPI002405FC35|nr:tetratricopeptide repeat-containing sensor histidine kinase [Catalinimonas alkaloidigena]